MVETAHFLGYESATLDEAVFSVIPAPYEDTSSYVKGQSKAPRRILDASSQIEDYDEESGISVIDYGVHCIKPESVPSGSSAEKFVKEQVKAALDAVAVPVILGGEGTVTRWGVEAILPSCDELSILHIDANADMGADEDEESHHQTVIRDVLKLDPQPHVCQVGIRAVSRYAFDSIMDDNIPLESFFMSDIDRSDDESWHDDIIDELRSPVYVSIDITGFDPAVIPASGHPEPGGLKWWPVLRLLKKIASRRRIAAFDITELCPRDHDVRSDYAVARLVYKLMNYIQIGGKMLEKPAAE
ncbi:MAG: arginase family protein [Planctomycetes bacterium]|nr:arginase family protein [Planctomycetota bacterium]